MNKKELQSCISLANISVIKAMERIQENAKGVLFIIDEDEHFLGSVTDGDIRRWIIKTGDISGNVSQFLNKNARYIYIENVDEAKSLMKNQCIRALPVLDSSKRIVDIVLDDIYSESIATNSSLLNVPIIIMAGGKGTRLYPYTKILPKPLIPIGEIPIIERIMNRLNKFGASRFYLIINYKKDMIKSYFIDQDLPYEIRFVEEEKPLGTAGGIKLISDSFASPVIITNCDILIEVDYEELIEYHMKSKNDMTIISSIKSVSIPYGVLETEEGGMVVSMKEKPQIPMVINTGMYILNPEYIKWIPDDCVFHMTQLAQKMLDNGKKVGMYPISENAFLDMGEFEEMKRMEERIK